MGPRQRHWLCLLSVGALRPVAAAVSTNLRHSRGRSPYHIGPDNLQVPDCTCGCCHVTYRTPDEMPEGGTVFLKCALDEVQGQSSGTAVQANKDLNGKVTTSSLHCGASCVPPKGSQRPKGTEDGQNSTDALLGMAGESGASAIDYNRYCFYNCRPYDFNVGNICTNLRKDTKSVIKDEVDHGLHPLVTDPKVQGAWGVSTGALPAPVEAPSTTTAQLPCAQSDPCAYGLM